MRVVGHWVAHGGSSIQAGVKNVATAISFRTPPQRSVADRHQACRLDRIDRRCLVVI
jgi:hypothetical protein